MKLAHLILAMIGAGLIVGCTNLPRSRDLANPNVSAVTLAQQVCSNCHGLTGNSVSPTFPNLASQTPTYIMAQLKVFKNQTADFEFLNICGAWAAA